MVKREKSESQKTGQEGEKKNRGMGVTASGGIPP